MSKIAKMPVKLPENVKFNLENNIVVIVGPKGQLSQACNKNVSIDFDANHNHITFKPATKHADAWAHAGTVRANINNMVHGVTIGFEKVLELIGVGYRAQINNGVLNLSLGYSHPIEFSLPVDVTAVLPNNTTIVLKSNNKQLLGQIAAEIRAYRPPEPYKGKGVKYAGELILRKEPKKK